MLMYGVRLLLVLGIVNMSLPAQDLDLDQILANMERFGTKVKSMSCVIHQRKWTHLLEEFDSGESGTFDFLRSGGEVYLKREILEPAPHTLVIREGKVWFYQPQLKQAREHDLGQNRDRAEFLLLGFGANREELAATYEISLLGVDVVAGRRAYQIQLKPRSDRVAAFFPQIVLWIDAEWWIPIQQKLVEPTRDYLLVRFDKVRLNPQIPKSKFKLDLPNDVRLIKS